jgi:linoleoyl-CoA desaturase
MTSTCRYYLPHGPFQAALDARVDSYFAQMGTSPQRAPKMWLKTVAFFAWLFGAYLVALLVATTWWQVGLAAVAIGIAMAGIGFNVQHDGSHGAYSTRPASNALAAYALDFIGASSYVWAWKHNIFHHSNPNRVGFDADIDIQPLCRLAPDQRKHRWHRFQHVYIWFLYSFLALKWLFDDFRDVFNGRVGGQRFPRPRGWQLVLVFAGKLFFLGWSVIVPAMLHPLPNVLAAWWVASVTISLTMAVVFQMAHVVERADFPSLDRAGTRTWAEHQVAATADFAQGSALVTWFTGGLNFQIEHHLFPKVCHLHLPALAPIVRQTCEEFKVPYFAYPTARAAFASHVRWLSAMGAP